MSELEPCQSMSKAEVIKSSWELDPEVVSPSHRFRRIIIDDVNAVKRKQGPIRSFMAKHTRELTGLVSAELMLNSIQDTEAHLKHLSDPHDLRFEDIPIGIISSGLYHKDYNPLLETSALSGGLLAKGIFFEGHYKNGFPPSVAQMKQKYEENGQRLWLLMPELLPHCKRKGDFSASSVIHPLMTQLRIKRLLTTPVRLPNRQWTAAGVSLKPPKIQFEEPGFISEERRGLMRRLGKYLKDPHPEPTDIIDRSPNSASTSKPQTSSPFSIMRWGTMTAVDSKVVPLMKTMSKFGGFLQGAQNSAVNWGPSQHETKDEYAPDEDDGGLTREHLRKLLHNAAPYNFPFAFYWETTLRNPTPIPPKERHSWLHYMTADAPVVGRAYGLIHRYAVEEKENVTVFTANPWGTR